MSPIGDLAALDALDDAEDYAGTIGVGYPTFNCRTAPTHPRDRIIWADRFDGKHHDPPKSPLKRGTLSWKSRNPVIFSGSPLKKGG